jgi:hypothetical protein
LRGFLSLGSLRDFLGWEAVRSMDILDVEDMDNDL